MNTKLSMVAAPGWIEVPGEGFVRSREVTAVRMQDNTERVMIITRTCRLIVRGLHGIESCSDVMNEVLQANELERSLTLPLDSEERQRIQEM